MVIISTSATEVSIQAVSPELGVQFSSVLASQAGGGGAAADAGGTAAAAGAAGAGAAACAIAAVIGSSMSISRTSIAAARRHADPIERTIIRTLRSQVAGQLRRPTPRGLQPPSD